MPNKFILQTIHLHPVRSLKSEQFYQAARATKAASPYDQCKNRSCDELLTGFIVFMLGIGFIIG